MSSFLLDSQVNKGPNGKQTRASSHGSGGQPGAPDSPSPAPELHHKLLPSQKECLGQISQLGGGVCDRKEQQLAGYKSTALKRRLFSGN